MRLSICIVNWNTRDYLVGCLGSIYEFPPRGTDLQVIVVDNASTDGSVDVVRERFPQAILVANDENLGYAEGNNQALEIATGDYVLVLNPDVIVHKDALTRSIVHMQQNPLLGAIGCRQLFPNGKTQPSLRSFPDPWPVLWEYLGFSKIFPRSRKFGAYRMTYFDYDRSAEVDQPMATFLLISRKCLDEVGFMDADFPIFFNDVDWCYRAKRVHGWRIGYAPEVTITHYGGSSTKQVKPKMVSESHQSLIRFYRKHYRKKIPGWLYSAITSAIRWNEKRVLRGIKAVPTP